jgi:hypothetical protein
MPSTTPVSAVEEQILQILKDRNVHGAIIGGGKFGDEGKGKLVDEFSAHFDAVVRFGGGAGAGHTVELPDGRKFGSHLIPCGIARQKNVFSDLVYSWTWKDFAKKDTISARSLERYLASF